MASSHVKIFDFEPVATIVGTGGSYTVPSGKYAQVVISLSVSFSFPVIGEFLQPTPSGGENTIKIMLKAGDVLSFSTSSIATIGRLSEVHITALVNSVAITSASTLCGHEIGQTVYTTSSSGYIASEYSIIT
jgi:hypothetical protein